MGKGLFQPLTFCGFVILAQELAGLIKKRCKLDLKGLGHKTVFAINKPTCGSTSYLKDDVLDRFDISMEGRNGDPCGNNEAIVTDQLASTAVPINSQVGIRTYSYKEMSRPLDQSKCICTNACSRETNRSWKP